MIIKGIAIFNYYSNFNVGDKIFNPDSYLIGENLGYPIICLKNILNKKGIEIHTADYFNRFEDIDAMIYLDHLTGFENSLKSIRKDYPHIKHYLLIMENEIIKPDNYDKNNHNLYDKCFTWNDYFVDGERIIKYCIGNKLQNIMLSTFEEKEKLACMICGNKMVNHPKELYSERLKAIEFFENNYPEDFDLYGFGWDKDKHKCYKGMVKTKTDIYSKYKFAFCYENAKEIEGYVTEKIWDVLMSGTIPIYYKTKELPDSIYVDICKFDNYQELYNYMKNMTKNDYELFINNIKDYLNSEEVKRYSGEYFAKTIIDNII
ncbi:MAG: hypothetical protein HGB12_00215 [Bacteroidetes bacterium]|nr:hypothetical protein [Bacteroidota bacterium]